MAKSIRKSKNLRFLLNDTKWKKIEKEILILKGAYTAIGLHSDANRPDGSKQALIGHVNEFGAEITVTAKMRAYLHFIGLHLSPATTKITIPERSFLRSWVDQNRKKIKKVTLDLYKKVLDGNLGGKQALALLGAYAEGGIKKQITNLDKPENHPFTVKQKGSSSPLIATGGMRSAIHHKEFYRKGKKRK